jgi:flagellar hook-associated protein 3 FlgL
VRVSTSLLYALGVDAIGRQHERLLRIQQHVASGRRMLSPSDDPIGSAQALTVAQAKARTTQYSTNVGAATDALAHAESVLGQVSNVLQAVRTHAVAAGGPALNDSDRRAIATDLRAQLAQLTGLANTKDGDGAFMFAGFATATQPFAESAGGVLYNGDSGQRTLEVSPGRHLPISASGDQVFMRIANGNGTFVAAAAGTNTGNGVISPGSIVDPASYVRNDFSIQFTSATTYDIVNTTTAAVVSTGNAYTSGSAITVAGMQVSIGGPAASGDQFTLTPSTSQSVFESISDLITTLEAGVVGSTDRTRLANGLNRGLADIDQALEHVLTVRAQMGAGMRELDTLASGNESQQLLHDATLSRLQDLDYNAALSDFSRQQLALEAAQKSFIQVSRLSLFDYL